MNVENLLYSIFLLSTLTRASKRPSQTHRLTTFRTFTLQFETTRLPTTNPRPTLMGFSQSRGPCRMDVWPV